MALQRAFPEAGGGSGGAIGSPSDVGLGNVNNTSDANKPVSTAQQAALDLKQDILAEGAFVDGDKTKLDSLQSPTAESVGLGNVNNTSDANKPVSTAQQTALNLKQNILAEGAFVNGDKTKLNGIAAGATANSPDATLLARANHTGTQPASTITGLTSASVGLGNVNNTSDANKPVSTAQQAALNLKATTNPAGITGALAVANIVVISLPDYNALVTKDPLTLYIIQE